MTDHTERECPVHWQNMRKTRLRLAYVAPLLIEDDRDTMPSECNPDDEPEAV